MKIQLTALTLSVALGSLSAGAFASDDPPAEPDHTLAHDQAKAVADTVKQNAKVVADAAKNGAKQAAATAKAVAHEVATATKEGAQEVAATAKKGAERAKAAASGDKTPNTP